MMLEEYLLKERKKKVKEQKNLNPFANNNKAWIAGTLEEEFEFDYEINGVRFYRGIVACKRTSGTVDHIPVIVSNQVLPETDEAELKGCYVEVAGEYRTKIDKNSKKSLYLYSKYFRFFYKVEDEEDENLVFLSGNLCKEPYFKRTSVDKRITSSMLAVNRNNRKAAYIPIIAWNKNAGLMKDLKKGTKVEIYGRMQSREHTNKNGKEVEWYEVSISHIAQIVVWGRNKKQTREVYFIYFSFTFNIYWNSYKNII